MLFELIDLVPAPAYFCEAPSGIITRYNRLAVELWGREPQPDTDRFCGAFRLYAADGTALDRSETPMAHALRHGAAVLDREAIIERPDGSRVAVVMDATPVRDAAGAMIGAVNVLRDIGESKRLEKAMHEAFAILNAALRRPGDRVPSPRQAVPRDLPAKPRLLWRSHGLTADRVLAAPRPQDPIRRSSGR